VTVFSILLATLPLRGAEQDLRVVSMEAPNRVFVGETLVARITLRNRSDAAIDHYVLRLRLFKDLRIDAAATQVQEFAAIAAGVSETKEIRLPVPAVLNAGGYILKADISPYWTDPGNTAQRDVLLMRSSENTEGQPDLLTANVELPSSIEAGQTLDAGILVSNNGTLAAGPFLIRVSLHDGQSPPHSLATRQQRVDGIPAGSRRQRREISLVIPNDLSAGEYVVKVELNPDRQFQELGWWNNTSTWRLAVVRPVQRAQLPPQRGNPANAGENRARTHPPGQNEPQRIDLRCTRFSLSPPRSAPNGSIHVRFEITNAGNAQSPGPHFRILISASRNLTDPAVLYSGSVLQSMPPGFTSSWPDLVLTIPAGTAPGRYFVAVEVDPENAIAEENERNNRSDAIALEIER
jgi:hypothetical protein